MSSGFKKTVYVGLSGGVDSSVSAYLLKKEGFNVVGVFIKTWHPDFTPCTWREERRDAMRVASHLRIPFKTYDFEEEYKRDVADYFINAYKNGLTPNPDVVCNRAIKFGAFARRAFLEGADFVATGHYARNVIKNDKNYLLKGLDNDKDQSYFLWTLNQLDLKKILFPVGNLTKKEVRKIALKIGLPNAVKKDSQGVCFLGDISMKDFLMNYLPVERGDVLNTSGKVIGNHSGSWFYTLGERHGFEITVKSNNDKPMFIIDKNLGKNIIVVSDETNQKHSSLKDFSCFNLNLINDEESLSRKVFVEIRYRDRGKEASINFLSNSSVNVHFNEPQLIAPGQSLVFYDGEICLGGAVYTMTSQ